MQGFPLEDRLLTKEDLAKQFNIPASNATLSRYRRFKGMPAPIRITPSTVRWRASEIRAWIDSLASNTTPHGRKTPKTLSDAQRKREGEALLGSAPK